MDGGLPSTRWEAHQPLTITSLDWIGLEIPTSRDHFKSWKVTYPCTIHARPINRNHIGDRTITGVLNVIMRLAFFEIFECCITIIKDTYIIKFDSVCSSCNLFRATCRYYRTFLWGSSSFEKEQETHGSS